MIKGRVSRLHSPDCDFDSFRPDDVFDVGILVQVMIGPAEGVGEESFDLTVCTPRRLSAWLREDRFIFGRHYLFVERFDQELVRAAIQKLVESVSGSTWREVALTLSRYASWEFEDYVE